MKRIIGIFALILCCSWGFSQRNKVEINQTFSNITEVIVDVIFCDIDIQASESPDVSVQGYIEWEKQKYQYEFEPEVNGTTLYLKVKHPRKVKGRNSGQITLLMPAMTDVDVSTVSGDIEAAGIGQRYVKLNTVSGNIAASKIGSKIKTSTVSGNINLTDIKGHVSTATFSGNHYLEDIDGNLKGSSISGNFKIINLKGNREISTVSGSVR